MVRKSLLVEDDGAASLGHRGLERDGFGVPQPDAPGHAEVRA